MNEIYGGSTVTLVVASSKAVTEGFLKDRQPQYIPIPSRSDPTISSSVYLSPEWDENEDTADGPWSSRGWTMQEGLLPNRLLYYTSSQMIWRCCEEERFERGTRTSLDNIAASYIRSVPVNFGECPWFWKLEMFLKFKRFKDCLLPTISLRTSLSCNSDIFRLWYELIEVYSPRRFTDISDRLVALSGLAKEFSNTIECGEYVAGLWRTDLIRGLMWRTKGASLTPRISTTGPPGNIFPSWSWASTGYEPIKIDGMTERHVECISRVQDVEIDLVDRCQPFGMVKSGRITITGPLKQLPVLYNKAWRSADESMSQLERYISEKTYTESSGAVNPRCSSPLGGHFAVLQVLYGLDSIGLLVLEATGGVTNGVYTYRRVGTLTLHFYDIEDETPPDTIALLDELGNSLEARLGRPIEELWRYRFDNEVVEELEKDPWNTQTIMLI